MEVECNYKQIKKKIIDHVDAQQKMAEKMVDNFLTFIKQNVSLEI